MRTAYFVVLALLPAVSALADASPSRSQANREAQKQFLELNFFSQGRGMHLSPGLITYFTKAMDKLPSPGNRRLDMRRWFTRRWGLTFEGKELIGVFDEDYEKLRVGALGCVACHSSRAAGQFVVGLGNKNIDVVQVAKDLQSLELWWQNVVPARKKSAVYLEVEADALAFSRYLSNERIGNLTQGLVPVSFVFGWFSRVHGEAIPKTMRRGQVKVPALWGYGEKRKAGLFSDGLGDGREAGWGALVELAAGQKPETVREYYPKLLKAEELFHDFLPPKYPFWVNKPLALSGKLVFSRNCAGCHGAYEKDQAGLPLFQQPRWIPWAVVRTDPDRTLAATPELKALLDRSPLSDIVRYTNLGQGYFAPRLEGIWARFPYLHNGSVPSVAALLEKPGNRPRAFSLKDAGEKKRFDESSLGLTLPEYPWEEKRLLKKALKGNRDVYYVGRDGQSNQGHDFHTDMSAAEKRALIEYLKTL